ncbi:MAG: hypothetical protein ACRDHN_19375, partial [Thermomicrobiales bacterium]
MRGQSRRWQLLVMGTLLLLLLGSMPMPLQVAAQSSTPAAGSVASTEPADATEPADEATPPPGATSEPTETATGASPSETSTEPAVTETPSAIGTDVPTSESTDTVEETSTPESGGNSARGGTFAPAAEGDFFDAASYTVANDGTTAIATLNVSVPFGTTTTVAVSASAAATLASGTWNCVGIPGGPIFPSDPSTLTFLLSPLLPGVCTVSVTFAVISGTPAGTLSGALSVSVSGAVGGGGTDSADVAVVDLSAPTATATVTTTATATADLFDAASYTVNNDGTMVNATANFALPIGPSNIVISANAPARLMVVMWICAGLPGTPTIPVDPHAVTI